MSSPCGEDSLSEVGLAFRRNFYQICPKLILYGIYLALYPQSISIILGRPAKTTATYFMLALTSIIFVTQTMSVATSIVEFNTKLHDNFARTTMSPTIGILSNVYRLRLIANDVALIIADAIVMWRAWALYPLNRPIQALMAVTVLANTAVIISLTVIASVDIQEYENGDSYVTLNAAKRYLSAFTNLLDTAFIAFRLWEYNSHMKVFSSFKTFRVGQVLLLLVETGLGFVVLQASRKCDNDTTK